MTTTHHRYPAEALWADYARAGAGLVATAGPLLLVPVADWIAAVLFVLALLFAVFAWRTFERQRTRIAVDEAGIALGEPPRRQIAWDRVTEVRLRYYSTKRDRSGGWMHLRLEAPGGAVRIDSTIEDFGRIAERASAMVRQRALPVDEVTRANFRALGAPVDDLPADGAPAVDALPTDH
ncbi:hypothetical protein EDC65_2782 [Stella humosa]|uniref:Uncharacterized protein n=1 Tax=Stella humosa TaxID=94 RepID=A0A3N1LHU3_9PROT|nr:hypothetical protein [Stella humosa]ROP90922.1 hypothetical protein EDC65_2782 [Stella humosa]BBK34728.1 hypothetical protein STHU_53620 [Stella humosa]